MYVGKILHERITYTQSMWGRKHAPSLYSDVFFVCVVRARLRQWSSVLCVLSPLLAFSADAVQFLYCRVLYMNGGAAYIHTLYVYSM